MKTSKLLIAFLSVTWAKNVFSVTTISTRHGDIDDPRLQTEDEQIPEGICTLISGEEGRKKLLPNHFAIKIW